MEDVAARAGVSRSLVSLVFRNADSVSDRRRRAVLDAAEELGYRPNRLARNLAQGRSMTVGVVIDDLQNPFFTRTVDGIEQQLVASGYQIILANGARDAARSNAAAATFAELQVDALVLVGPRGGLDPIVDQARRVPTVVIARPAETDVFDTVRVDERQGARLVVDHLRSLGHRTIAHVDGGDGASAGERRDGYRKAMTEAGLGDHVEVLAGDFTHEGGVKAAIDLSQRRHLPSAVFAGNDLIAAGMWMQLTRAGFDIPRDLSLVGFDDSATAGYGSAELTTVHQPAREIGVRAVELLLERLDEPARGARHEAISPSLVERSSTRRRAGASA